jgi:hypothetical protein
VQDAGSMCHAESIYMEANLHAVTESFEVVTALVSTECKHAFEVVSVRSALTESFEVVTALTESLCLLLMGLARSSTSLLTMISGISLSSQ